jgi:hypothetical protein
MLPSFSFASATRFKDAGSPGNGITGATEDAGSAPRERERETGVYSWMGR